jgi:PAS domain S-box-containing protein
MEWVHCHIARQPAPPSKHVKEIPAPLSAIVLKLLAKAAEERYQTAAGVASDLLRCLAEWEARHAIDQFPLGTQDMSDRLLIPEKLYGREREIEILLAAFDGVVANGTTALALVSGYSGIGKSSVVNELHKVLVAPRGLFASGKFDQYKRDIPYATLAQAFQSLVRPLLGQSEAELGRWRDALRKALGPNGQLMVNLVPDLELVVGTQPPVVDLPPQDAKNRFQIVFRRFLGVFASKEHPLALFLDDMQWLDSATLELLEHLITHPEVRHLFLVGAYRDNEVGPAHPLTRTLETIREAGVKVHDIVLASLRLDDVGRLVADALHSEPQRARPLAQLMHDKTNGNPFFAIQFFTALADEGLLAFDPVGPAWRWDIDRIRARSYTDNVVDLMAAKLKRLSATAQEAMKQLACLGNAAEIATLATVHGETAESMHTALWEAVHAGLILYQDRAYKFLHDRIQQAAYSLIPEEHRARVHLRIGRVLLASLTADELAEHLFDVANQLNRGVALLVDRGEKAQVATISLRAGRKAKASAAYASACVYFATGMALLDESDWGSQYELMFSLWFERAECEFLTGNFDHAEQLIGKLLRRAASQVDQAAAHHLQVQLHVLKSENPQAVASALTCLQGFGIDLPAHPTWEQVQAEYETVWQILDGRPIEGLIDLPLMTDPDVRAAMYMLSALIPSAYFTDFHLYCLLVCRMVNVSMRHGTSGASAHAYGRLGTFLGPAFQRYREGYRFAQLACDLVEKHRFVAYQAKVHHAMAWVACWTQPITTAIDFNRAAFRTASEMGDLTYACYTMFQSLTGLLLRSDSLEAVWRESERGVDFARKARFRDLVDNMSSQQRFIATMLGRTTTFSTFSDAQFDESAFEAQLTGDRAPSVICWYWILKLKARFMAGEYAEALSAAGKANAILWASRAHVQLLDYFYYTALTVAAIYENGSADEQTGWRDLLTAHREQLREWADNYPPTFGDKHVLVSAEIARIEGRDTDAMRLYEQAIQAARENGFVQNEGLAHEVAARFYAARGFETIAHAYLRNARHCYVRWGAHGKVRQLDQRYPRPGEESPASLLNATIGTSAEQLDIGAVLAASQAVSGEIVLDRLIETLMTLALEHAGAERGLLILLQGDALQIEAEVRADRHTVEVTLTQETVASTRLPESLLHTVIRTQESVILDDASAQNPFSADEYIRQKHPRSVLCLPLVKQAKLIGLLYLENNLASHVFTPARIAVLRLLSSQAAISLENARLYAERQKAEESLRESEQRFRDYAETASDWLWETGSDHRFTWVSERATPGMGPANRIGATRWEIATDVDEEPEKWRLHIATIEAHEPFRGFTFPTLLADGSTAYVATSGKPVLDAEGNFYGYRGVSSDVTAAVRADQAEHALREAQAELAHVARVTTLGELAASIAHEINQPLSGIITNASTCLRMLAADSPNLDGARETVRRTLRDGNRAADVITRLRALFGKKDGVVDAVDLNEAAREVIAMSSSQLQRSRVVLRPEFADNLPPVTGDRVQLQQVILNLLMNAADAMSGVDDRPRQLVIRTQGDEGKRVRLSVQDVGVGVDAQGVDQLFEPFYTTKSDGMGIGLSVSRSIIESHGGRLWAQSNDGPGATFSFSVPCTPE